MLYKCDLYLCVRKETHNSCLKPEQDAFWPFSSCLIASQAKYSQALEKLSFQAWGRLSHASGFVNGMCCRQLLLLLALVMQKKRNKIWTVVDCFETCLAVRLNSLINILLENRFIKQMCHQKIKLCLSLCIVPILFNSCVEKRLMNFSLQNQKII